MDSGRGGGTALGLGAGKCYDNNDDNNNCHRSKLGIS